MLATIAPVGLLVADSLVERLSRTFFDDTFAGIHQLQWFDYAILVPYFLALAVLGIYGLHRYITIYRYWRYRKNLLTEPPGRFQELPRVTIQLPIYNERFVVGRLIEAVSRIRYPRDRLQIQVLDDSTDDTCVIARRLVAEYQARGVPIEYRHRTNRRGFKAGALDEGLRHATGELIAIFDADFVPDPDFLEKTVHYFTDPKVGLVQTRWAFLNRSYNLLTEVQAILLDGHFLLEHVARSGSGLFFNFNGTAGILRREMIEDAGGWEHDTLTEDCDLSYRAQLRGWKFVYLPHVESPSELPVETYAFQVQQSRWAKGLTQVALKLLPSILRARIPLRNKVEAIFHLTPNISYPLMIVVCLLVYPAMVVRFYMGWQQMLLLDLPVMAAAFFSIIAFYVFAEREHNPRGWKRSIVLMPMVIAAGIGLTLINTKAVIEAVTGFQTAFARTAKYAVAGNQKLQPVVRVYRRRSGWLPFVEIACGVGFLAIVYLAIDSYNFLAVPFLMLFVAGFLWAGVSTLIDEFQARLRWEMDREAAAPQAETVP